MVPLLPNCQRPHANRQCVRSDSGVSGAAVGVKCSERGVNALTASRGRPNTRNNAAGVLECSVTETNHVSLIRDGWLARHPRHEAGADSHGTETVKPWDP